MEFKIASQELLRIKVSGVFTEVTWQMSSVISQPRLLTSHAKINTEKFSAHTILRKNHSSSSLDLAHQVEPPVPHPSVSYIHSISQELDLLLMSVVQERENLMVSLIA